MVSLVLITFCTLIALGFGIASALSDIRSLTIPNNYVFFILGAFIIAFSGAFLLGKEEFFSSWKSHLIAGSLIFMITYTMFYFKAIGGGDAKLLSVYGLWVGLNGLMPLLFAMAVGGGLLAAMTLILNKKSLFQNISKAGWIGKAQAGEKHVPYGVAIFLGALFSFWQVGYLKPSQLMLLAGG